MNLIILHQAKARKSVIEVFYNRFGPKVNHVNETSEKVTDKESWELIQKPVGKFWLDWENMVQLFN